MQKLTDGILLYHGSYIEIPKIDLNKCAKGLDFGKGFYLTSSFEQASKYIPSAVKKNVRRGIIPNNYDISKACVSIYKLHLSKDLIVHYFETANLDWLHFVASNRNNYLFQELKFKLKDVDIIGGKIANDNTAIVLNAYVNGDYGIPGTKRTDDFTIESLLPNKLEDQFCFLTSKAINALEFLGSEPYGR